MYFVSMRRNVNPAIRQEGVSLLGSPIDWHVPNIILQYVGNYSMIYE